MVFSSIWLLGSLVFWILAAPIPLRDRELKSFVGSLETIVTGFQGLNCFTAAEGFVSNRGLLKYLLHYKFDDPNSDRASNVLRLLKFEQYMLIKYTLEQQWMSNLQIQKFEEFLSTFQSHKESLDRQYVQDGSGVHLDLDLAALYIKASRNPSLYFLIASRGNTSSSVQFVGLASLEFLDTLKRAYHWSFPGLEELIDEYSAVV